MLRVDGRAGRGEGEGRGAERGHAAAEMGGQHVLELHQRAHGGLLDARDRGARGGAEADGDRDRLVVVEQQRRHRSAGTKAIAASRPRYRLDRISEVAQPLDVAPDRPRRHSESPGELVAAPVAPSLQQRQQLEKATGSLAHDVFIVARIEDSS